MSTTLPRLGISAWLVWGSACGTPLPEASPVETACTAICEQVVGTCDLASWPSYDSCFEGCVASDEAGADLASQQRCVELAACDLFAIVECERDFGAPQDF